LTTNVIIDTDKEVGEESLIKKEENEKEDKELIAQKNKKDTWQTSKSILGYLKIHLTPTEIHNAQYQIKSLHPLS